MAKATFMEELFPTLDKLHISREWMSKSMEYSESRLDQCAPESVEARIEQDYQANMQELLGTIPRLQNKWLGLTLVAMLAGVLCTIGAVSLVLDILVMFWYPSLPLTMATGITTATMVSKMAFGSYNWLRQNIIYDPLVQFVYDDQRHLQLRQYLAEAKLSQ